MEPLCVNLLVGLLLSGLCVRSSFAFPPEHYRQQFQRPQVSKHTAPEQPKGPAEERELLNTVRLTCYPDSLEIVIEADMFGVGAPVDSADLRLGVEHNDFCRATVSSEDEYRIIVGLMDCGTKHWMTEDSLVYTNLLLYSPEVSPSGVIRMDEAVIPIECHYERKYSLSSSSLMPTWIPFMSTQAAVETLDFNLRIMTNDWLYERSSNVFYLGEPIRIEASVRVGHHMGLRVFVSSCVATLHPDIYSIPRYVFVENGCLVDSELPGSKSSFLPRTQDDKLQLVIDAFRFHNEDRGELYITCYLNAVPVNDAEAPAQACTLVNGRWRSADGNDYLCGHCQSKNEVGQSKPSSPAKLGPRGFGKEPESFWRSGLKTNKVWEQEAKVGPMLVLPAMQKSGPIPVDELPPLLGKISRPALYGSQWRSGINDRADLAKGVISTPEQGAVQTTASEQDEDLKGVTDLTDKDADSKVEAPLEKAAPVVTLKSKTEMAENNSTAALGDISSTDQVTMDVTLLSNVTATDSDLSQSNDPKR
ncbi:zona pellucida sperm-binding protein 3-like isoform X1 [Dicentrarchus labrax]|uniref:Zona pellucida sperm-binding protein 3 n=1 Tax=Dicentrarchus labrax TaxID=13489 RepID=A0A8C4DFC6_DICLA|nr:zona pellucida sperm-binding protein 3-like isoform X1 [Dicentrarchus labrax]